MGSDLGGGRQRTGKRLRKAKTASAAEENTKATSEQMKQREWKACAAFTGSHWQPKGESVEAPERKL